MAKNKFDTSERAQKRKIERALKRKAYFEKRKPLLLLRKEEKKLDKLSNPGYVPGPNRVEKGEPEYSIILHEGGKRFHGLTILDVADCKRDNKKGVMPFGIFLASGTVTFITPGGKKWHIKVTEFCFLINPKY